MPQQEYEFVDRDRCPGCRADQLEVLHRSAFAGLPLGDFIREYYAIDPTVLDARPYQLDRCRTCRLVFQHYVGAESLLSDLYTHWVRNLEDPENDARYREDVHNIGLSRDAHEIMAAASFVGKPIEGFRTLDYGMGWALWARIAQQLGCTSYGSDLSRPRMDFAANQEVIPVEDSDIAGQQFDFINTEQVFEHVPDPAALLGRLAGSLAPGGIIKLSVPSGDRADEIVRQLNDGSFKGDHATIMPVHPLEHINTFVREAIDALAAGAGLEVVRPGYYHRFAFLRRRGTLDLLKPRSAIRELVRPWYQFRNPTNIYVWLRARI